MRQIIIILLILTVSLTPCYGIPADDNEFAEFEDESEQFVEEIKESIPEVAKPADKTKKAEDDFNDEDFGINEEEHVEDVDTNDKKESAPQPLKFADVPSHFRSNWASYQVEGLVVMVIVIYLVNYAIGKALNQQIATQCFESCKTLLEQQFSLVGDDGVSEQPENEGLRRETDSVLSVWCSGRVNVNYLQMQMKMIKRQDLVSRVMELIWPSNDRLTLKISLEANTDADPIILCLGERKAVNRQVKEMLDLATFTTEKRGALTQFNIPNSFTVFTEQAEAAYTILEPAIVSLFRKYEEEIEFLHISDQFVGPKLPDGDTYTKMPEVHRLLLASFNLSKCNNEETLNELLTLIFYLVDKLRKIRLSKEAKAKADKKRKEFEELFQRTAHAYRQEVAQARREEKTRERKQKLMEEEDPDKQRRLEAKELKREAKAKSPKMKQMKMK